MSAFPQDPSYCNCGHQQRILPLEAATASIDPQTVLIVDDDSVFRQLEARALCKQGYKVLEADCAAEALRLAGTTANLHLLLTDLNMPGTDGFELTRQFRALHPRAPVLMVSNSLPPIQHSIETLDRFAMLEKSSSFDVLLEKVRLLLSEVTPLPF